MKIRTGFVSNSSSSSYVCYVCGEAETVYDGNLSESGLMECEEGHVFCDSHALEYVPEKKVFTFEEKKRMVLERACENLGFGENQVEAWERFNAKPDEEIEKMWEEEDWEEYDEELEGEDIRCCPICQMTEYNTDEALHFLMLDNGLSKKDLLENMKALFSTYQDMANHLKANPLRT